MSNSYDTNDFGEVLRYADGILTGERRDLTEYEEQLIEQLSEAESNLESIEEENRRLKDFLYNLANMISGGDEDYACREITQWHKEQGDG